MQTRQNPYAASPALEACNGQSDRPELGRLLKAVLWLNVVGPVVSVALVLFPALSPSWAARHASHPIWILRVMAGLALLQAVIATLLLRRNRKALPAYFTVIV